MAVDLPDSPSDGQVSNGLKYSSSKGYWDYDTASGGATTYATVSALPTSGVTDGTQAFVTANSRLYIYNGSGWYSVALLNTSPTYSTTPNSTYTLAQDGTATTITIVATDPEGFPITYTATPSGMGSIATLTGPTGAGNNVFTVTPSTDSANAGSFTVVFRATDGVNNTDATSTFTLVFLSPYWKNISLSSGTSTTNALQNSTYIDRSSNSFTVTASGAVTGGSLTDGTATLTGGALSGATNITASGELDAATLDISGNGDIDGSLETDALSINGTTITSTATELNILDGVTSTAAELNILDGVTSTAAELNILDGVTSTTAELNIMDGVTSTACLLYTSPSPRDS